LAARVAPPPPPQPPPPPPPQHELPPPPQPPPSLPEPELYDSLMQLHRLCGGDLTCCIDVAARVHRLPKHRVFEMFRLMLEHGAFSDVPASTASSAGGPPPTAPVHSRLPPLPPLPPEQPATAPPAIGARVSSLAPTPRHLEQSWEHPVLRSSGDLPAAAAAAAAAPGLPAAPPLWQPQQQPYQQPYQQQQLPMPGMPMPGMGGPQLLQPEHRPLQPQTQHERQQQHQRQPAQPPLPPLPPQPPPRQQQQAYTHDEPRGLRQGGMSGGMSGGVTLAMLQARQEQLQQRQVRLVITPDHSTTAACLPPMSRSTPRARLRLCCLPLPPLAAACAP